MTKKKKKENRDAKYENLMRKVEESLKNRDLPEDRKKHIKEFLKKEIERAKERKTPYIPLGERLKTKGKVKIIKGRVKNKKERERIINDLKMQLVSVNLSIREAEEGKSINLEVLRKLHHLKSEDFEDRKDYFEQYDELQRKLFFKNTSKIEELKDLRERIIKAIKEQEENKKGSE